MGRLRDRDGELLSEMIELGNDRGFPQRMNVSERRYVDEVTVHPYVFLCQDS